MPEATFGYYLVYVSICVNMLFMDLCVCLPLMDIHAVYVKLLLKFWRKYMKQNLKENKKLSLGNP